MTNFQEDNVLDNAGLSVTSLTNAVPQFLAVTDSRGTVMLWNSTAALLTGQDEIFVKGRLLTDIGSEYTLLTDGLRAFATGKERISPIELHLPGGTVLQCTISSIPQLQMDGQTVFLISGVDVSSGQSFEEEILRNQRLKAAGSLANSFVHDFNNIINGISGSLAMIEYEREDAPDMHNENYTAYLDTIRNSMLKAGEMIKQLKAFSPGHRGKESVVDLCEVLNSAGGICRQSFADTVEIEIDLEPEEAPVQGDPVELEEMVLNLCRNSYLSMTVFRGADEYSGGTLKLTLKSRAAGIRSPMWEISVKDTGVGIPEEERPQIFDPVFVDGNDDDMRVMNLSIVYSIASRYNGTLELDSIPGAGTEVRVLFPVPAGTDLGLNRRETQSVCAKILICDDEDLMRQVTGQMLERQGYTVVYAANGEEALSRYQEASDSINLVILDLNLYEESGLEVFRRLKVLTPELKVVISSGYSTHEHITEAEQEGAAGFLQKPFTMDKLLRVVEASLTEIHGSPFTPLQEAP